MLIKSEVTGTPQTPPDTSFFLLCGYRLYTASKAHRCSKGPQLASFSLNVLISKPAGQVSELGYLCPGSPASPLGLWGEKGMCFLEAKNGRAWGCGGGKALIFRNHLALPPHFNTRK